MMTVRIGGAVAFEERGLAAPRDVSAAVGVDGRLNEFAVLGEELGVGNFDVGYYVGWHWGLLCE